MALARPRLRPHVRAKDSSNAETAETAENRIIGMLCGLGGLCVVRRTWLAIGALIALSIGVAAQQGHAIHRVPSVPDELLNRPVPLRSGIGTAHDSVGTTSKEAQAFYDQGLAYLHSYVWIEAARSFNQALRIDPGLAIAHAGLSVALVELNAPAKAQAAIERARALSAKASAHDRAHIDARALQISAEGSHQNTALASYRSALDAALQKYPADVELWLLRGISQSADPADRGQGSVETSVPFYERALGVSPNHFAAQHYLSHAHENGRRPGDALPYAAAYAKAAPAVPHALHMHGHVLRQLGRVDEAVAAFESAQKVQTAYLAAEKIPPELDWHYEHNVDLLAACYRYLGRMRDAEAFLSKAFVVPSSLAVQMFNKREWPDLLIARGRTTEAIAAASVLASHPSPLVSAIGHVVTGRAYLAAGQYKEAADAANTALRALKTASGGQALVSPELEVLQGEFFLRTGQPQKGRAMLDEIVRRLREGTGPDSWAQTLFTIESVARAARQAGDWEFAGFAARQLAAQDSRYAGAHYALGLVAEHNGDTRTAQTEFALAEKAWSMADTDLTELREIRSRKK
jgi:tetratricopeptide (TPR) repeat protein